MSLSFLLFLSPSRFSLSLSLPPSLSLTPSLFFSLSVSLSVSLCLCLSLYPSLSLSVSVSASLSLFVSPFSLYLSLQSKRLSTRLSPGKKLSLQVNCTSQGQSESKYSFSTCGYRGSCKGRHSTGACAYDCSPTAGTSRNTKKVGLRFLFSASVLIELKLQSKAVFGSHLAHDFCAWQATHRRLRQSLALLHKVFSREAPCRPRADEGCRNSKMLQQMAF